MRWLFWRIQEGNLSGNQHVRSAPSPDVSWPDVSWPTDSWDLLHQCPRFRITYTSGVHARNHGEIPTYICYVMCQTPHPWVLNSLVDAGMVSVTGPVVLLLEMIEASSPV